MSAAAYVRTAVDCVAPPLGRWQVATHGDPVKCREF